MRILLIGATAALLAACAGHGAQPRAATPASDPNLLTADQIAAANVRTAYEAVLHLRPRWLTHSGATGGSHTIRVVVDDVPYFDPSGFSAEGGPLALRAINATEVLEIRYLSADDATLKFGSGFSAGALLVKTVRAGH